MQILDQLGDEEIQVGVALSVRMGRHVDRHVIDLRGEIGAMVEVEGAQEILVGFSLAGMLHYDQSRHVLEDRAWPQQRWLASSGRNPLHQPHERESRDRR